MPFRSYSAGDSAPDSGIYHAMHRAHRTPHPVVVLKGETFPSCRCCGSQVRFELVEVVPHATHDWDFAGPSLVLVKGEKLKRKKA